MKELLEKIKPMAEKAKKNAVIFAGEVRNGFKADDGAKGVNAWKSRFVNLWRSGKNGKIAIAGVSAIAAFILMAMLPGSDENVTSTGSATRGSAKVESGGEIKEEFFKEDVIEENKGTGLIERARNKTGKAVAAYAAVRNSFYGIGRYKNMMKVSVLVGSNGTPAIRFNEEYGAVEVGIRLSVNEPYYNAWKKAAHKYLGKMGMADRIREFKDIGDSLGMIVGEKFYTVDAAEFTAIKDWMENEKTPVLSSGLGNATVCLQLVGKDGQVARTALVSMTDFVRSYPAEKYGLPFHEFSRLMDLPEDIIQWYEGEKPPNEDTFAAVQFQKLTKDQFEEMKDIRCTILDNGDFQQLREQAAAKAIGSLISGMVKVPGQNFLIGNKEVSRIQWDAVMENFDGRRYRSGISELNDLFHKADDAAMEISWNDSQVFVKKLNDLPAVKAAKLKFRLPKDSEWLLAWKADGMEGKRKRPGYDDEDDGRRLGYLGLMEWQKPDSGETKPGQFALYHLHDNASDGSEWCEDGEDDRHVARYGGEEDDKRMDDANSRSDEHCLRLVASPE